MTGADFGQSEKPRKLVARQLAYERDEKFYRIVALSLGSAISLSIVCSLVAVLYGESVPNGITAIGSGAVGALAGVFTASRN